jgi:hypothetical protein
MFVKPNIVHPLDDMALFLTFFENPVVVTVVVGIWAVYFLMLYWARQEDKKDILKVKGVKETLKQIQWNPGNSNPSNSKGRLISNCCMAPVTSFLFYHYLTPVNSNPSNRKPA